MAISQKLKEIYGNYYDTSNYYEAIEVSHPNFNFGTDLYPDEIVYPNTVLYPGTVEFGTSKWLIQSNENMYFTVDGVEQLFLAYPFGLVPPEVGSDQQDLQIVFDNVSREIIDGIELASENSEIPIKLRYFIFVDDEIDSQITPITLNLTNISANLQSISATATRADLFKYQFPTKIYGTGFEGLYI